MATSNNLRYDVCLSFANENRAYVREVAAILKDMNIRVFYDYYEQGRLWGKNLYEHLYDIYNNQATYCVIFISEEYAAKLWANHELQAAQAGALAAAGTDYILPARFDDTELSGLPSTIGYIDLATTTPEELANLLADKLNTQAETGEATALSFIDREVGSYSVRTFQGLPLRAAEPLPILGVLDQLTDTLLSRRGNEPYWTTGQDRLFDRLYATSSVMYFLAQRGLALDSQEIATSADYLDEHTLPDISSRAGYSCLLHLGRMTDHRFNSFLNILVGYQIPKDDDSPFAGSFLLPQGNASHGSGSSQISHWSDSPIHRDGASFHACFFADLMLHIPAAFTTSRETALNILGGVKKYIASTLSEFHGALPDLNGRPSSITLYAFALLARLGLPLPGNWREVATGFAAELHSERDVLRRSFGLMNMAYMADTVTDDWFLTFAARYAETELSHLSSEWESTQQEPHELAAIGRALIYGLNLVVPWSNVLAAWHLLDKQGRNS